MKKKNTIFCIVVAAVVIAAAIFTVAVYRLNNSGGNIVINVTPTETESSEIESYEEDTAENVKVTVKKSKKTSSKKKTTKKKSSSGRRKTQSKKSQSEKAETKQVEFPLELNMATAEELCCINGVGETLAANIISYRESIGGYINREQLLEVNGIGEKKYASIKDYLYIENEQEMPTEEDSSDEQLDEKTQTDEDMENDAENSVTESQSEISDDDYICVELNSAELDDLEEIPCFDEDMCVKILELRDELGGFGDVYEIMYVDGMTKKLFCEAEKYLYVENEDNG